MVVHPDRFTQVVVFDVLSRLVEVGFGHGREDTRDRARWDSGGPGGGWLPSLVAFGSVSGQRCFLAFVGSERGPSDSARLVGLEGRRSVLGRVVRRGGTSPQNRDDRWSRSHDGPYLVLLGVSSLRARYSWSLQQLDPYQPALFRVSLRFRDGNPVQQGEAAHPTCLRRCPSSDARTPRTTAFCRWGRGCGRGIAEGVAELGVLDGLALGCRFFSDEADDGFVRGSGSGRR